MQSLSRVPARPTTLELEPRLALDLALAAMLARGLESDLAIGGCLGLRGEALEGVLARGRRSGWIAPLGATGRGREMGLKLTDAGRERAREAHDRLGYTGPIPVPIDEWVERLLAQRLDTAQFSPSRLARALEHLALPPELVTRLGPAFATRRAVLFFGAPGNGKSAVATAIGQSLDDTILVPRAIEVGGTILEVFDPSLHEADPEATNDDPRYVACRRPFVRVGGELTLDMLEVSTTPHGPAPHAPLQWKVAGGVLLIDDFGRQRIDAKALLDRWIVPLERGIDHLRLADGRVFEVPFDALVLFSTNASPRELFDAAHLRRVPYRFELAPPTEERFLRIWELERTRRRLPDEQQLVAAAVHAIFQEGRVGPACYQPGFLLDHVLARLASEPGATPEDSWIAEAIEHLA
jgi:MoxR-like ATPase